jgi:PAS domain S-box-containing protein
MQDGFLERTVLYVDDEPENLDGFKFSFRKDFNLYLASNTTEAFEILQSVDIKVVISDQRMPDMQGTDFLAKVAELYPDTIRLILTAFTDAESIMEAINKSNVYRFLTKPWNRNDLRLTLQSAIETYELKTENQLLIDNLRIINDDLSHTNLLLKNEIEIRKKTEEELGKHRDHLEELVKERTEEIQQINEELIASNEEINNVNIQLEKYKSHLEELVDERTQELIESEKRLKTLSDSLPGGVIFRMKITKTNSLELLYASAQFKSIIGVSLADSINNLNIIKNLIPEKQFELLIETLVDATKSFKTLQTEFELINGKHHKWIQIKAKPIKLDNGEILWDGFAIDITQRKNSEIALSLKNQELVVAEEELRSINEELRAVNDDLADKNTQLKVALDRIKESESKYRELFDKMLNGFAICKGIKKNNRLVDFQFIDLNPAFQTHAGIQNNKCLGKTASELKLEFDEFWFNECQTVMNSGITRSFEKYVSAFKRYLYVSIYKPADGHFAFMFEDITERKEIENALRENEEKYRLIVEGQSDIVIKIDTKYKLLFVSPSFCKTFGVKEENVLGKSYLSFVAEQTKMRVKESLNELQFSPHESYTEYITKTTKGDCWLAFNNSAITDSGGNISEIIAVGRDITERKNFEKEVLSKNQFLEGINNATPDSIFIMNHTNASFDFFNDRLTELFAYSRAELQETSNIFEKVVYQEDMYKVKEYLDKLQVTEDNEVITSEVRIIRKDNTIIWLMIREIIFERDKKHKPIKTIGVMTDITNWKMAEESIRESEERYRSLFEQAADGILVGSHDGTIIDANSSFTRISGFSKDEVVGKNINFLFQRDALKNNPLRYDLVRSGHTVINERDLIQKNGKRIAVEMNSTQMFDGRLQAFFRDITERKKADEAIKASERKFKAIFNQTFSFLCILDTEGQVIDINNSSLEFTHLRKKEIIGIPLCQLPHWQHSEKEQRKISHAVSEALLGNIARFETTNINQHNDIIDIDLSLKPVYDEHKKVILLISEGRDITNRKKAELALRDREQLLKSIIDQAAVGISRVSVDNKWLQVNPMICKITGYAEKELLGKDTEEITYPDDFKKESEIVKNSLQKNINQITLEKRYLHKNGNIVWVKLISNLVKTVDDTPNYFVTIAEDITDIKRVQDELVQSEQKFKNIFNNSTDAIAILNKKGQMIEVNSILLNTVGAKKEKVLHTEIFQFLPKTVHPEIEERLEKIFNGETLPALEADLLLPGGKVIPSEINSKLIRFEGEDAILSMVRDITERKEYEKRVLEAIINTEEREREKFARNLHDDLGPLLSSIKMYMNSFKTDSSFEKQKFIIEQVNDIVKESITTTKEISNDLSPHILTNYGLHAAIESFLQKFPNSNIELVSNLKSVRVKSEIEFSLYRIVKELINNTMKHAKATQASIQLMQKRSLLHLIYTDDGVGFDANALNDKKGMGLFNILSRLKSLNGKYKFPQVEKGMKIEISVPFEN